MKRMVNKTLAYCCFGVLWITSVMPMRVHYFFSDIIYLFVYRVAGYRRHIVRQNLSTAFPEKTTQEIERIERQFYHWFCDYLVETIKLMTISSEEMQRHGIQGHRRH